MASTVATSTARLDSDDLSFNARAGFARKEFQRELQESVSESSAGSSERAHPRGFTKGAQSHHHKDPNRWERLAASIKDPEAKDAVLFIAEHSGELAKLFKSNKPGRVDVSMRCELDAATEARYTAALQALEKSDPKVYKELRELAGIPDFASFEGTSMVGLVAIAAEQRVAGDPHFWVDGITFGSQESGGQFRLTRIRLTGGRSGHEWGEGEKRTFAG